MMRRVAVAVVTAAVLAIPSTQSAAQASTQIPGLNLSFVTPFDVVGQHTTIDIFIRLALDASAANPFVFDGSTSPFGFPPSLLPTSGTLDADNTTPEDFAKYDSSVLTNSIQGTCDFCSGGYTFNFNFGAPSLVGLSSLTINPGDHMDFLFGTFTPDGGTAPAGTYNFYQATLSAFFRGEDAAGDPITGLVTNIVDTCDNDQPSCAFTREVIADVPTSATPEPSTFVLMATGIGIAGFARRRRANKK